MVQITYIEFDGTAHVVDVPAGWSVMEGAVKNGVPGIIADCGGACACATCQIMIDPPWDAVAGGASSMEEAMLELALEGGPNRRLSCQVAVIPAMDGMIVRIPEVQG